MKAVRSMNRRSFIKASSLVAAGAAVGVIRASASFDGLIDGMKREAKTAPVKLVPLTPGLSVLENTGGNITIFHSPTATLLVDSGIAEQRSQIFAALRDAKVAPVKDVVNTHWHFDHTSGNSSFHEGGARLTAHENTLKHLLVPTTVTPWKYTFEPIPRAGRPTNLLRGNGEIDMADEHAAIYFVEHAHTDGDLVVHFEQADVISTGDVFWNGHYPFIDNEAGGSIDGMIKATQFALARSSSKTVFVPGHGPVASKANLQEYLEMLGTVRDAVARLKARGLPMEEVTAAKPTSRFDSKYGDYAVAPDDFVRLVFQGV